MADGQVCWPERVVIDGLAAVEEHLTGVGQYLVGLLRGMDQALADRTGTVVQVLVPYDRRAAFDALGLRRLRRRTLPVSARVAHRLWRRGLVPPLDLGYGRATYLFPRFTTMPLRRSSSAVIVYDVSYAKHPEFADEENVRFLCRGVARAVRTADRVITISESVRGELLELYGVDALVATPATDPALMRRRAPDEVALARERYGLPEDYLLAMSTLEPRKNLEGLIEAYCALPGAHRDRTALVLVGAPGWRSEALMAHIERRQQEGFRIVRPSERVADLDRAALLTGARALVYPSHYEGFGMPPLEALACGTPVITSGSSSLPEVVGHAGVLVDARDATALAAAIQALLDDPEAAERARSAGPAHAAQFSWVRSAERVLDVLSECG